MSTPIRALLFAAALVPCAGAAPQTLIAYDSQARVLREFAGPPVGPCLLPAGPLVSVSPLLGPGLGNCALPAAVPAPPLGIEGDAAVDRLRDIVYVTDGTRIARVSGAGVFLDSFLSPMPALTGLGFDGASGRLWVTDGDFAAPLVPPALPACAASAPPLAAAPFLLPLPLLPATGLDVDPFDGSLFVTDAIGGVTQVLKSGLVGPRGTWSAAACGLGSILADVAVDASALGQLGAHYVTDGKRVAYILPGGTPAPSTWYTPNPCFELAIGGAAGLGFAARPLPFGAPSANNFGVLGPRLETLGQAVLGNGSFVLRASGGPPVGVFVLWTSPAANCPPVPVTATIGIHLGLSSPTLLASAPALGGAAALAAPLAPVGPVPLTLFLQGFFLDGVGGLRSTNGLALSLARP